MRIKEGLKVMFGKSVQSISNAYPNIGAAIPLVLGDSFRWDISGRYAYNTKIFYSAQNIIVRKLTEVPIMFSKRVNGSAQKFDRFYSKSITNDQRIQIKTLALEELENHELNDLFDNPNDYQSGIEMMEDFWFNYGFGDGYLWFETLGELSRNTKPQAIHSLARNRVEPVKSNSRTTPISHYNYTTLNGEVVRLEKENVLHLKHWNPNISDLKGLGVDQVAAMDIALNSANNVAQGAAFRNGGRGTLFSSDITTSKDGDIVEKATAGQMSVLKETLLRDFSGAVNNRRMHFTNGMVNAQNYGDTLAEMELIGAENNNWKNIFAICGLSVSLTPDTSGNTENNVKAGFKSLVTNLAIPELRKFDHKLTKTAEYFYPGEGIVVNHDLTEYTELAPDLELMSKIYDRNTGPLISEDERRSIFGHDKIGGEIGAMYLIPSGLIQAKELLSVDPFADVDPNANSL